jgi:hypothetical protein
MSSITTRTRSNHECTDLQLPEDWIRPRDLQEELNTCRIRTAWGDWLNDYAWSQFSTLTFKYDVNCRFAVRCFKGYMRIRPLVQRT